MDNNNALEVIRAAASYHRNVAGLFWILDDEVTNLDPSPLDAPFRLAIRAVLKAHDQLVTAKG